MPGKPAYFGSAMINNYWTCKKENALLLQTSEDYINIHLDKFSREWTYFNSLIQYIYNKFSKKTW